jgi:uncharacterized Zn-finger protein
LGQVVRFATILIDDLTSIAAGRFSVGLRTLWLYTFQPDGAKVSAKQTAFSETDMAGHTIPHFQNDGGHSVIEIGVKEFMCTGASSPFDHPHIFIDLGHDSEKVCSYCSTLYRYNPSLKAEQTNPPGCVYHVKAA